MDGRTSGPRLGANPRLRQQASTPARTHKWPTLRPKPHSNRCPQGQLTPSFPNHEPAPIHETVDRVTREVLRHHVRSILLAGDLD
eukprot:5284572-Pyramimonas_sp.AAC.1